MKNVIFVLAGCGLGWFARGLWDRYMKEPEVKEQSNSIVNDITFITEEDYDSSGELTETMDEFVEDIVEDLSESEHPEEDEPVIPFVIDADEFELADGKYREKQSIVCMNGRGDVISLYYANTSTRFSPSTNLDVWQDLISDFMHHDSQEIYIRDNSIGTDYHLEKVSW